MNPSREIASNLSVLDRYCQQKSRSFTHIRSVRMSCIRKLIRPVDPDRIATQFFAVVRGDLHMRALSGLLPDDLDKAMRRNVQGAVETFWPVLRPGASYGT